MGRDEGEHTPTLRSLHCIHGTTSTTYCIRILPQAPLHVHPYPCGLPWR
jgi:hypothetical protein